MNQPAEPFRIVGNVYFVGTSGLGVYLIATPAGHVLLDSGFPESVPLIAASVAQLGFRFEDVRILLASHAHIDHVGGHALVRQRVGARVLIAERDAPRLRAVGRGDFAYGDTFTYPPCPADATLQDGDRVELGGSVLTARLTAGHTEGATTWTMALEEAGQPVQLVFFPSAGLPDVRLRHNPAYPDIARDYEQSFAVWKALACDVFLGSHTVFFDLARKRDQQKLDPGANPFVDATAFRSFIDQQELRFRARLAAEGEGAADAAFAP
jgi:metallo-beta-lactamase class B